jgi:hypothetical protein
MGQAKSRVQRLQKVQPRCIYCGGGTLGTTADHMPPISIFNDRHRPKGMEFLACSPCNSGSKRADQVAGMMCRVYPDVGTAAAKAELAEILRGIHNNFPGMMEEMAPERGPGVAIPPQFPDAAGALTVGPMVQSHLLSFAAKVGLALHFNLTKEILQPAGGLFVRFYPNHALASGEFPSEFLDMLGPPSTLRQGRLTGAGQFEFASKQSDDEGMTAHAATFRPSFAVAAFVARDFAKLSKAAEFSDHVFRPGCLKVPPRLSGLVSSFRRPYELPRSTSPPQVIQ